MFYLKHFVFCRWPAGTTVVVRSTQTSAAAGTTLLPKYAVRSMMKTFGLTGIVLDVDQVSRRRYCGICMRLHVVHSSC